MSKDAQYLAQLQDYYAEHRILPSLSGIADLVGMKAKSAASGMVNRLIEAGYLAPAPGRRIQPTEKFFEREVLDAVQAGAPQSANDSSPVGFNIDDYLIDTPSRTVLLTVKGDSMIEAGLMPGDTVIVKKGAPAQNGEIVVAIVDGEYTVKYLAHDKNGFYLKPGNKNYSDIRANDHLEIFGLVVASFRKYRK